MFLSMQIGGGHTTLEAIFFRLTKHAFLLSNVMNLFSSQILLDLDFTSTSVLGKNEPFKDNDFFSTLFTIFIISLAKSS